jgi:hypothetical protein
MVFFFSLVFFIPSTPSPSICLHNGLKWTDFRLDRRRGKVKGCEGPLVGVCACLAASLTARAAGERRGKRHWLDSPASFSLGFLAA